MSLPQQQRPQLRNPLSPKTMRHPSQSKRPPRHPTLIENSSRQPPTTLHHQPRIHRIPVHAGHRDVPPNLGNIVLRPVTPEVHPPEILLNLPIRQMSKHHHPGRHNTERKTSPLEKNMTPNGKSAVLPDQADRLLPPPRRKERTLPGRHRQPPNHGQRRLGDVVPSSRRHTEKVKLRPQDPLIGLPLHQPDTLQRHQQPVHSRPRQPRLPGHSRRRRTTRLMNRDRTQRAMGPSDEVSRSVHSVNTTPPESTARRTIRW